MFRFRLNCRVTDVVPRLLDEVISLTDAIWPNCLSSGVATEDAIISGLAQAAQRLPKSSENPPAAAETPEAA